MKLLLLLLTFVLGMGNISSDSENRSDESLLVNVKVTLSDGTVENFNGTYKESLIFTNGFEEILACTYVTPSGELNYSGMRIIETLAVSEGDFVGGETSVVNVLNRSGLQMQIGLDGNDLTQNKQTLVLEKRMVQFVSANDANVLIKGDFATAKTALTAT